MSFAIFIRRAREESGLEHSQLAKHINMSTAWVRALEYDKAGRCSISAKSKSLILYYIAGLLTEGQILEGALLIAEEASGDESRPRELGPHGNRKLCPPRLIPLLGTMTDKEMAKRGKVSYTTARNWRLRKGNPPAGTNGSIGGRPRQQVAEILRANNDPAAGRLLGVSRARIQQVRKDMGIESAAARNRKARESAEDAMRKVLEPFMDDLGKESDLDLAQKAGVTQECVNRTRREAGIPAYSELREKVESVRHLLGEVSDNQLGKRLGIKPQTVTLYRHKWGIPTKHKGFKELARIDWDLVFRLWKQGLKDKEIAERVGSTRATIAQKRTLNGWVRSRRNPNRANKSVLFQYHGLMFTHSDEDIAKRAGVGVGAVRQYRMKHNIVKGKGWKSKAGSQKEGE